jgi:hypothetical protein
MPILWRIFFFALVTASLLFLAWILFYPKRAPRSQEEALSRMIVLERDGRYDDAVKTVQAWLQDSRRDVSRDGLLYEQVAMVYLGKAHKKPESKEDSVHQADLNFGKALGLHDQEQTDDLGIDFFEIGGGYELLGDLPVAEKCNFYEKARQLFERELPLLQVDTYTAFGKTYPLKSLRAELTKHLACCSPETFKGRMPDNPNAVNGQSTKPRSADERFGRACPLATNPVTMVTSQTGQNGAK